MLSDLKYAFRMLLKTPGFTIIAVLTLALGIGANSAIFSVIDAVLLRPLPFTQPGELISVWSKVKGEAERETSSFPDYADLRDQAKSIRHLAAYTEAGGVIGSGGDAREVRGLAVTSEIFSVLGVQPLLGRAYTRAEEEQEKLVVVISHELWRQAFNSDPNIIGRDLVMSLRPFTIVGVMPPGFRYPVGAARDYYTPLQPLVAKQMKVRGAHFLRLVGRLQAGADAKQANAEVSGLAARLAQQYPDSNTDRSYLALSLKQDLVGDVRVALLTILAAVVVVLLIACANVANLLLARATARKREIAIRTALGASRVRVVRQLLAEGLLLAFFGGLAGLLLAWWGVDLLRFFGPKDVPRLDEIRINGVVIIFTFVAAVVSTLLFAIIPALQVSKPNVSESLQEGNRGAVGPESHRLRALLVIAQVALSMLLLAGAGLLIKSFGNLSRSNPGFDPQRAMMLDLALPRVNYTDTVRQRAFMEQLQAKLSALPGVEAVGGAMPMPFSGNDRGSSFWIAGRPDPGPGNHPGASHLTIKGDYFRAMRIPLLAGRIFDARDGKDAPPVVMVNEEFVRKFFPGKNPIGERVLIDQDDPNPPAREIIGVVGGTRHESLAQTPLPEFYVPFEQAPDRRCNIVLRTASDQLGGLDSAVRNAIHEIDRDVYVAKLVPLSSAIGTTLAQPRFHMLLLGSFAGVAMILAAIGIYGVIAYSVAQRTKEIGIRMALGAQRGDMLQMILRQSLSIVAIGLAAGLLGAFALTRLMSSLLYGVSANDLSIYVTVLFVLAFAALLASYLPARRAMKVDPMIALRCE